MGFESKNSGTFADLHLNPGAITYLGSFILSFLALQNLLDGDDNNVYFIRKTWQIQSVWNIISTQ